MRITLITVLGLALLPSLAVSQNKLHDFTPSSTAIGSSTLTVTGGIAIVNNVPTTIPNTILYLPINTPTIYVYVDLGAGTIAFNTTGFTATVYPVAIVTTDQRQISNVRDVRTGAPASSGSSSVPAGVTQGSQLVSNGSGQPPLYQLKPVIDVRDTAGVDCTGATDSSTALNTLFTNISGSKVIIPNGCTLQAASQIVIFGQTNFLIEGQGFQPNQGGAPFIFGCSGSAGPVLLINRSSYFSVRNFGVYAKGTGCSSSFTGSIQWNNLGPGGKVSTYANFEGMALTTTTSGTAIANYIGFQVGDGTTQNLEQASFQNNYIQCQNSSNSYGIFMNGQFADDSSAVNNRINNCFQALRDSKGTLKLIERNHMGGNGNFSVFGVNGADIFVDNCGSGGMNIIANEVSDGGPFINSRNDTTTTACPVNMIGNIVGVSDLGPNAYPINLGLGTEIYFLEGNQVNLTATTSTTIIGSSAQSNCGFGPLGTLIDIGNSSVTGLSNAAGWAGCWNGSAVLPYQQAEYHLGSVTTTSSSSIKGQFISTLSTGTAPLSVASTTPVANLSLSGGAGTSVTTAALASTGNTTSKRFNVDNATTITSGAFAIGAGWGSTASIAITVATSKDSAYIVTITTGGSGIAANPTLQITFVDGTWTNIPACRQIQTGGNDIFGDVTVTARSATAYTYQWAGTATSGKTYEFTQTCTGT
jgi:hypothetical protein